MFEYETRLDIDDYIIVQDTDDYGFSQDSVILANLADIGKNDVVLDIGCGTGILSTLAIVKKGVKSAVGIDVQKHACDLARKSVQINGLQDKLQIIDGNKKISSRQKDGSFALLLVFNLPRLSRVRGLHRRQAPNRYYLWRLLHVCQERRWRIPDCRWREWANECTR